MSLLHHLLAWLCHHVGHRDRSCNAEQMAALTLYPKVSRRVKAEPQSKERWDDDRR